MVSEIELWFQGGIRNGRKLDGERARKVFELTGKGRVGGRFLACHYLTQEMGKPPGITKIRFPYSQRYEIAERREIGKTVILRAKLAA